MKGESLIDARNAARKAKNFKEADRIRDELSAMGIQLKDAKDPDHGRDRDDVGSARLRRDGSEAMTHVAGPIVPSPIAPEAFFDTTWGRDREGGWQSGRRSKLLPIAHQWAPGFPPPLTPPHQGRASR